jgi:LysM repeat protein
MKTKPKSLEPSNHGFDSQKFWRHYVATVDTDQEWEQERPQPGRRSNRLFLFLLLFHIFLIGSIVLFNLVAERPKPAFAEGPASKSGTYTTKTVTTDKVPSATPVTSGTKQDETIDHRVALGDSLKSIANASGVSQEEIARMNQIEVSTQLAVGSILRVPKPKAKPAVIPTGVQPARVDEKVLVQATTAPSTANLFRAVERTAAMKEVESAPAPKATAVVSKLPEEKAKPKVEDTPPSAKPKAVAKVEETPPAKPKATEIKAVARPEPPPAAVAKSADVVKASPSASTKTAEPAAPKPAAASTAKPAASGTSHTVKPKETFYSISRKYGVKVDDLMRINNFSDPAKLREGIVLKVPK